MRVGLDNCADLFQKLKYEKERLDSNWNAYDFFNFVVTAWHLKNDWLKNNSDGRPTFAMKKVHSSQKIMADAFNVVRDIANGSKHFKLEPKAEKKKVVTEIHQAEVKSMHSYFFGAKRAISTNEAYYTVDSLAELIISYFTWVFDDDDAQSLPEKTQKILDFCKSSKSV